MLRPQRHDPWANTHSPRQGRGLTDVGRFSRPPPARTLAAVIWDAVTRTQLVCLQMSAARVCCMRLLQDDRLWMGLTGGRVAILDVARRTDVTTYKLLKEWRCVGATSARG